MPDLFEATKLTEAGVAKKTGFLDWNAQPSRFKHYPDFLFRYTKEALGDYGWLLELRRITDTHMIAKTPYHRLNTPSAGNLHPLELYVQIRGVKGIISGIYHIDAEKEELVLIYDIERDGLEPHLGMQERFRGVLLLMSQVPFRSFWKYGPRAWRYLWLDAGHQLATIETILQCYGQSMTILSGFDVEQLEHIMGFDNKERCCQVMAIGELSERKAQRMERPLMHVLPTDYSEPVPKLPRARPEEGLGNAGFFLPESVGRQGLHALLQRRRSAREFAPLPIREGLVEQFMNIFGKMKYCSAAFVVLRAEDHRSGIYREKEPLQKGFFDREVAALLVNQRFVASAGAVIVVHTKQPGPSAHLEAGMAAQGCYLLAEASGMGCSGIGAYYDDALRSFLTLDDEVVYAIAIGARDENRDT